MKKTKSLYHLRSFKASDRAVEIEGRYDAMG